MDNLKIEATKYSPEILFDYENNIFEIRGDSYPEDIEEFYGPVLSRMEEHLKQLGKQPFVLNVEFIYFNSGTARVLTDLFDMLEQANTGRNITVNWIYEEENESALESGEEFEEDMETVKFNLIQK